MSGPLWESRNLCDFAHMALRAWLGERAAEAGYPGLPVADERSAAGEGSRLLLWPYRLAPWPRRVEGTAEIPLLRVTDRQAGVPEPWRQAGRRMTQALDALCPPLPSGRPQTSPPLAQLPPSLRAWYQAQGEGWRTGAEGEERARLPALMWRPAFTMRTSYLVFAETPPGATEIGASLLCAVALALNRDRTLPVLLPGPAPEPALLGLLSALAEATSGPLAEELRASVAEIQAPATWNLTLVAFPDADREDWSAVARALGRPLSPCVSLALQLPLGSGPVLASASSAAVVHSSTMAA